MRTINDFGYVKTSEIRSLLFYALLPILQEYLPIEQLSHLALVICAMRLLHCESVYDDDICKIVNELFLRYYKDHDDYYIRLQNFVLHLHAHYPMIYRNFGALCNSGCLDQEDLIRAISSHHNGTRCYGESICLYYNINFFLNRTTKRSFLPCWSRSRYY